MFVIVYGALRSGTTLLRLMLDMHPGLSCPGETDFLFDFARIGPDGAVTLDTDALGRNRIYQASRAELRPGLEGRAAIEDMIAQLHQEEGDTVVLMLHRGIETALRLFPDTPVLHMLRDPRDVAKSCIPMGWAGTTYHGVELWLKTEREWDRAAAANPDMRQGTLRYESLIADPEGELGKIADLFGVDYRPEMLDYAEGSTYAAPDLSLVEQWKRKQSPEEVALVEGRLGPLLGDRGYAPSGHGPMTPGAAQMARLWAVNKAAIWRMRVARYGLVDPVLMGLSRKLGIDALGHGAQRRMNEKQVRYLK